MARKEVRPLRRSERIAAITNMLTERPHEIVNLTYLSDALGAAKSTLSEDIAIIRETLATTGSGRIQTISGAAGGVRYEPALSRAEMRRIAGGLAADLANPERLLPGGYLYMSDIVAAPRLLFQIGQMFATIFSERRPEAVVTVETRGIPIAMMTARALNVPLAIVRRVSRMSEGTVITMNYVSGSDRRIETMSLSRRAITPGTRVLITDDFMKAGGTARGLVDLMGEFEAEVVGVGVVIETAVPEEKLVQDYTSLVILEAVHEQARRIDARPARWLVDGDEKKATKKPL